jgi:hypothetical protein
MEVARTLVAKKGELARDVVIAAFSGEERGTIGSGHFVGAWAEKEAAAPEATERGKVRGIFAMINMDMVGRMGENRLQVFGASTAREWPELVGAACDAARIECAGLDLGSVSDGFGPSDQTPFYAAGVPVVHLFTGSHGDYHKPSDSPEKINAAGIGAVATMCATLAATLATREGALAVQAAAAGPASLRGDRRSFNASLGTIPNYAGPGAGKKGVLLDGVRPAGAAEKAGMRRGDVLVKLGPNAIGGVEDLMFALNSHKPGETVSAVVVRDGAEVTLEVTFQEGHRAK